MAFSLMVSAPWRWHARLIELWDEADPELIGGRDWDAVALESLAAALDELAAEHGDDPDGWQWGKVHRIHFAHALAVGDSGAARVLDRLLSRWRPAAGGHETVNAIGFIAYGGDFTGVYGPTFRLLADLGDPDASRWQHMTGQSGHPGSRHYDDLIDDWLEGRTNPVALAPSDTLIAATGVTPGTAAYTALPMGRGSICVLLIVAAFAALAATPASAASLYDGPGPKPGPPILYEPLATSPQLENTGVWKAAPILVSGASAYRDGEYLYQDYLYDDHGARQAADPGDARTGADTFSRPNGTYTYPTNPAYAANAADLVELRVKPLPDSTAFRITLNTMNDPSLVAGTIAIGDSATPLPLPYGANATAPAQYFLTWHGTTADLRDAATGAVAPGGAPSITVDKDRRQVQINIPHTAWNPGTGKVKLAAGVGLWDAANDRYLVPGAAASATQPGGAGVAPAPEAFFNVAFRSERAVPGRHRHRRHLHQRGLVARQAAGHRARDRQPRRVPGRGRLRQARRRRHRRQRDSRRAGR